MHLVVRVPGAWAAAPPPAGVGGGMCALRQPCCNSCALMRVYNPAKCNGDDERVAALRVAGRTGFHAVVRLGVVEVLEGA